MAWCLSMEAKKTRLLDTHIYMRVALKAAWHTAYIYAHCAQCVNDMSILVIMCRDINTWCKESLLRIIIVLILECR